MAEFETLLTQGGLIALAALVLWLATAAWRVMRARRSRVDGSEPPPPGGRALRALRAAGSLGLVAVGLGLADAVLSSLRGSLFMPWPLKLALVILLALCVALEVVLRSRAPPRTGRWIWLRSAAASVILLSGAVVLGARHAAVHGFDPAAAQTLLAPPFTGTWVATGAGPTAASNHHHRIASQRHAVDLARLCDDGRLFQGSGAALADSCTWGAEVRAPVDGSVVRTVDGLPDQGSRQALAGNHVVIRLDDARYVALAHLQQGSIRVAVGDPVRCGEVVGRVGASGNTDFPHLHVHVQDSPDYDLRGSRSIPFRFRDVEIRRHLWWQRRESVDLLANDAIRAGDGCRGG